MKKILPFDANPPIISYQYHAFGLGILFQHENFIDYFIGDYNNIKYNMDDPLHSLDFCINFPWIYWFNYELFTINFLQYSDKSFISKYSVEDFISTVIYMINLDFYIYSGANEYYLPNRRAYNKNYGRKDCIIYGYDTDSGMLNSIGYDANGIYKEFQISYEDYFNSILSYKEENWYNTICFLKVNPNYNFCLNLSNFKRQISDYLHSTNTNRDIGLGESIAFGIKVYDIIIDNILREPKNIHIGYMRILMEHKNCMYLRIEYLLKKGYLKNYSLLSEYESIVNDFKTIFNLSIKNNVKYSEATPNRIVAHIKIAIDKEKVILSEVLDSLMTVPRSDVKEIWDTIKNT